MALDYHYKTIGFILKDLVDYGLRRADYSSENALEVMLYREGNEEDVLVIFNDVLHWMLDEGLMRAASIQAGEYCDYFNGVQLTAKGIAVINAPPIAGSSLDNTIEKTITEAPKGDLGADIYAKIGSLVGGLLGGFQQSYG